MGNKTFGFIHKSAEKFGELSLGLETARRILVSSLQISIRNEAEWQAGKPARIQKIKELMYMQIQMHMLGWVEKVDEAINDADDPADDESVVYWFIALAGNLCWAATSLKPVQAAYKTAVAMSFIGAAVGSGTVQKIGMAISQPEHRKSFLKGEVAKLQGIYLTEFQNARDKWAERIDSLRINPSVYPEYIDNFTWNNMFPIAADSGTDKYYKIYVEAKANAKKILEVFDEEWEKYKPTQEIYVIDRRRIFTPGYGKPFNPDPALQYIRNQMENIIRSNIN